MSDIIAEIVEGAIVALMPDRWLKWFALVGVVILAVLFVLWLSS